MDLAYLMERPDVRACVLETVETKDTWTATALRDALEELDAFRSHGLGPEDVGELVKQNGVYADALYGIVQRLREVVEDDERLRHPAADVPARRASKHGTIIRDPHVIALLTEMLACIESATDG